VSLLLVQPDVAGQGRDVLRATHAERGVLEDQSRGEDQALPRGGRRERDPDPRRGAHREHSRDVTDAELRVDDLHRVVSGVDLLDFDEHLLGRHEGREGLQVRGDRDHSTIRQGRGGDRAREGGESRFGDEDVIEGLRHGHRGSGRGDEASGHGEPDVLRETVLESVQDQRVGLDARDQPATTGLRRDGLRAVRGAEDPIDLPADDGGDGLSGGSTHRIGRDGDRGVRGAGDEGEVHRETGGVGVGRRSLERVPARALGTTPGGADPDSKAGERRNQKAPSGLLLDLHGVFLALAASRSRT